MNIRVNKSEFIKALLVGGSFAGRAKALPILDCVKIKVKNGSMVIVSSDNENAISKRMYGVESEGEVSFCVNYKNILSYVKLIGSEFVELVVDDEIKNIEVKHEKGSVSMPLYNADEFPIMKPDDDSATIEMESALLNNWIVDGQGFTGDDELRPVMQAIYFYCSNGELGVCSSDGHYMFTDFVNSELEDFSFMLNKGSFKAVCDVCKDADYVKVSIGSKNIRFSSDDCSVLSRCTEGRYPNFKMILPKNSPINVKVLKKDLVDAINRCKLGASQVSSLVKLSISGINLEVSAQDLDFNVKSVENMFVEANGNITIGFHAGKLLAVLGCINSEYVNIELTDASRAGLFKEDDENSNKMVLLMPMMLN